MTRVPALLLSLLLLSSLCACSDDALGPLDGGGDALPPGDDAGMMSVDTGMDTGAPGDAGIDAGNTPPVASAGMDLTSIARRRITLQGSATDVDEDTLVYTWTQTSGPPAALADATTATPSFWARYGGTYAFSLSVTDGEAPVTDAVQVFVHDINGGEHSVALKPDGTLWAWGENGSGQLGDGTTDSRSLPGRVCAPTETDCAAHPFTGVISISTGRSHTMALKSDGTVWAWGDNGQGQLGVGDDSGTPRAHPTQVCAIGAVAPCTSFLTGVVGIAAGYVHSTALLSDGSVVAWGDNAYGQLGNDQRGAHSASPVQVCSEGGATPCSIAGSNALLGIERLAAGGDGHTLALKSGELWAWGANKNGQTGPGEVTQYSVVPVHVCAPGQTAPCVSFLRNVVEMDAWSSHSLAMTMDGALWAWGSNDYGQLSNAVPTHLLCQNEPCYHAPVRVCLSNDDPCTTPFTGATMIAAARRFSVALKDGQVWSWGYNPEGQLGHGTFDEAPAPARVCAAGATAPCATFLSDIVGVTTGNFHTLALDATGALWGWGHNYGGQLGNGTTEHSAVPVRVTGY